MRVLGAGDFAGRVTFFTGPGRASGKTSLLLAALAALRREGVRAGVLGIGFEGEAKGLGGAGGRSPRLRLEAGEFFAGAAAWLAGSGTDPEILALVAGSGAFGRLALARARRSGEVVLVGPESNEATADAVSAMLEAGAGAVLVDGAFGRLTQVAAIPGSRFFSSYIVDRGSLRQAAGSMRRLVRLASLPLEPTGGWAAVPPPGEGAGRIDLSGPLASSVVSTLPGRPSLVTVEDFTKVFLEDGALRALQSKHRLAVRTCLDFGGIVAARRGISAAELLGALAGEVPEELLFASPYEDAEPLRAA